MDKRIKVVLAGLCLCLFMLGCAEDTDLMPKPDMQEILDHEGIDDIKYRGNNDDTTKNS